ncbi:hypothetical protein GAU_3082 [Gemmatimonas aurantiaca T-27]|uniref:HEAT repeat domain-containing protein n=2 Tax=Gemmatimonas aurantiaca TaxID=173480 RepID=C1AC97_GEMAT|nr:hypothetical protein GAU_3082 [Gemmatimonas aurantiaca T-27]
MGAYLPEYFLSFEIVYAAAFAMLVSQLRDKAAMADVLTSVQRLCALARVGSVTLRADMTDAGAPASVQEALDILRQTLGVHDLEAIDISATVTDAELIKLAGILVGPPSSVHGSIIDTADALSVWNVRLHVRGVSPRPTPPGMHAVAPDVIASHQAVVRDPVPSTPSPIKPAEVVRDMRREVADAVVQADAAEVVRLLESIEEPPRFAQAASMEALVLAVEHLVDVPDDYDRVHAVLRRAGAVGARALFRQLMASTETAERRLLYDASAAHPAIADVARAHVGHPTWYVVRNAAGLLGESGSPQAIPDLSKLLRHDDQRVRAAAVVALGRIGGPAAMARLESVLTDPSSDVRNRALALVFASPESDPLADRMLMALEEESTLEFQLEMIHALAHVPTTRARNRLVSLSTMEAITADDFQLRLAAMAALAAGHRPAADAALYRLLDDPSPTIAERAAALLG